MALESCVTCKRELLTEADPYMVFPRHDGYHCICIYCMLKTTKHNFVAAVIYRINQDISEKMKNK